MIKIICFRAKLHLLLGFFLSSLPRLRKTWTQWCYNKLTWYSSWTHFSLLLNFFSSKYWSPSKSKRKRTHVDPNLWPRKSVGIINANQLRPKKKASDEHIYSENCRRIEWRMTQMATVYSIAIYKKSHAKTWNGDWFARGIHSSYAMGLPWKIVLPLSIEHISHQWCNSLLGWLENFSYG